MIELPTGLIPLVAVAASAFAAWWSVRSAAVRSRVIRLAATFVVGALVALPLPAGLLAGVAAVLAGRGIGLAAHRRTPGASAMACEAFGLLCAQGVALVLRDLPLPATALGTFLALQAGTALAERALPAALPAWRPRRALFELANAGAAAVVAHELVAGSARAALASVALVLLANDALARLARVLADLEEANARLGARVTELATLHAIGREILSTLDPDKVFAIVDRECRKILDVDFFFIGVLDPATRRIRISYRAGGNTAAPQTLTPESPGLAAWVVREKRAIRLDDATAKGAALPFRPHTIDPEIRSILAVPLLVEEHVTGVISVQSRKAFAYDDDQLSVLSTIAQQTAVAIENARHYTQATVDSLTGLTLRDAFFARLEEEYSRARRYAGAFAILMIDLDGFKEINDRQGHLAGDRYLRALGTTIRSGLRGADLACRYGGDEFCILLPETDLAGATPIAERMRQMVSDLVVDVEGAAVRTTASIGIAAYPDHDLGESRSLLLRADQALYQAKRAGRDRLVGWGQV